MPTRILIVEDEPNIVESLSFLLEREGFEVGIATDGEIAIQYLDKTPPEIMILDVMLPKRNGFEILRYVRSNATLRDLLVIVLTAKGQQKDHQTAEQLGADAFITKPFSNQDMIAQVHRIASRLNREAGENNGP